MQNNDLISRSALLEAWREIRGVCVPDLVVDCMIGEAPAVDAEPVVRCRECKHGMASKFCKKETIMMICAHPKMFPTRTDVDFFCAYGEKMVTEVE